MASEQDDGAPEAPNNDTNSASANVGTGGASGKRRRKPQRDAVIVPTSACEFWHDPNPTACISFPVVDHREHWPLRSREFKMWLAGQFCVWTGGAIRGRDLEDSIRSSRRGPSTQDRIRNPSSVSDRLAPASTSISATPSGGLSRPVPMNGGSSGTRRSSW